MQQNSSLQRGWVQVQFKDVAVLIRGVTYQKKDATFEMRNGYVGIYRANNIQDGFLNDADLVYVPRDNINPEQIVKKNDVILAMSSGSKHLVGKCAQSLIDSGNAFGAFCGLIRSSKLIEPKFLGYFFETPGYRSFVSNVAMGVNINNLRRDHIESLNIPLCSLLEQKRIVAKIESLFSRLDNAKDSLMRVRAEIKRYRQAVLKWAFEGKLCKDKVVLKIYKVKDIFKLIDGDRGSKYPKKTDYTKQGYCLFLSTKNVRIDGFKFNEKVYISEKKHKELRNGTLERGDIVITTRGTLGNVALYDLSVTDKVVRINSGMLILRLILDGLNRKYLTRYIISPLFTHQIDKLRSGTAQPQLPVGVFKEFVINIPNKEEDQNKIVYSIESRFERAKALEDTVEQGLKKVEQLKQSVLKKAFEGKLVEPDSNDEAVEVLLERIKKEKAKLNIV